MGLFSGESEPEAKGAEVDPKLKEFVDGKVWKIRPCDIYKQELKACTGLQGRFYQYFVDGQVEDCNSWHRNFINCEKWNEDGNYKAAEAVILNEEARMKKRFVNHYRNNVWENRDAPPEDWNKPLPAWMQKEQENSYLYHRAEEFKSGVPLPEASICSIM